MFALRLLTHTLTLLVWLSMASCRALASCMRVASSGWPPLLLPRAPPPLLSGLPLLRLPLAAAAAAAVTTGLGGTSPPSSMSCFCTSRNRRVASARCASSPSSTCARQQVPGVKGRCSTMTNTT